MARQRGQIIDKGHNRHLLRVPMGKDETGKRIINSKMFEGTISEAKKELSRMLSENDVGTLAKPSKETVRSYLSAWIDSRTNLSIKTKLEYTRLLDDNVFPFIGGLQLSQLSPGHVRSLYARLTTERKLGPRSVQYTHTVLSQGLSVAEEDRLIGKNPCKAKSVLAAVPRVRAEKRETLPILTAEEQQKIVYGETDPQRQLLWYILLMTGLRPQEALAVQWQDLRDGAFHIVRAIEQVEHGGEALKDFGKTDASVRVVHLDEEGLSLLQAHRARQAREILSAGEDYQRNDFIFATSKGTFFRRTNIAKWWKLRLAAEKIPHRRLYSTRHSHASHLMDLGENPKAVAERLGHTNPAFTLQRYTHTLPETGKRLAEASAGVLKRKAQ